MNRQTYEDYLSRFNARDYDGVLAYYADQFEITFGGYTLRTRDQVRSFYGFLHRQLTESITVDRFISDNTFIAMEARVRLEGVRQPTPDELHAWGYDKLMLPPPGQIIEIPQLIHYHLENGKITKALCAVVDMPHA
jgi:hypothetical protein